MPKKLLCLILFSCIISCVQFLPGIAQAKERPWNILFILVDAANPDHFSSYGYHRKTTPNFDKIASDGILFENAISQAWYTLPSHASLFTSKYPHTHNVLNLQNSLPDSEMTLAEILRDAGYNTAAFVGGVFLEPVYGMDQGFSTFYSSTAAQPDMFAGQLGRSHTIVPKAIQWLELNKDRPFFLFVHNYDLFSPTHVPDEYKMDTDYEGIADELLSARRLNLTETHRHTYRVGVYNSPYMKEVQLNARDIDHIISDYDDGLNYSDAWHKKLFDKLKELRIDDHTIIIITSDHGTDLLGHGKFKHYMRGNPYDEVLKVPLIIRHPGLADMKGRKISQQVQLIDLMPTILDFLGISTVAKMEGQNLSPILKNPSSAAINPYTFSGWGWLRMIRTNNWKLIYQNGLYELYNLKNDPAELNNLANEPSTELLSLLERLFDWSSQETPDRKKNLLEIDERMRKSLREAGYW